MVSFVVFAPPKGAVKTLGKTWVCAVSPQPQVPQTLPHSPPLCTGWHRPQLPGPAASRLHREIGKRLVSRNEWMSSGLGPK